MKSSADSPKQPWPELPLEKWQSTYDTLHMWTQIVGKVRLALSPLINHWWEVAFYVNARGLTTSAIPYGDGIFEVQFDFIDHKLTIQTSWGSVKSLPLKAQTVADFYSDFMSALHSLGIEVKIWTMPVEVPNPIRFETDTQHASYDPEYAHRFWRILTLCDKASRVMGSAPTRSGARRPENRVTQRSKLPQKKWTGLSLPMKRERNSLKTVSHKVSIRQ